jgi:Zn-dependent protease with chaperone function
MSNINLPFAWRVGSQLCILALVGLVYALAEKFDAHYVITSSFIAPELRPAITAMLWAPVLGLFIFLLQATMLWFHSQNIGSKEWQVMALTGLYETLKLVLLGHFLMSSGHWGWLLAWLIWELTDLATDLQLIFAKLEPLPRTSKTEASFLLAEKLKFKGRLVVITHPEMVMKLNAMILHLGFCNRILYTPSLIWKLNGEELEAVTAHELGHYQQNLLTELPLTLVLSAFPWFLAALLFQQLPLTPLAILPSYLVLALSTSLSKALGCYRCRRGELAADRFAVRHLKDPTKLAQVLRQIELWSQSPVVLNKLEAFLTQRHPDLLVRLDAISREIQIFRK